MLLDRGSLPVVHRDHTSRLGISLIEVVVCAAILTLLIAIGASAVARCREAANRARCGHHLREIGVAFHGFAEQHSRLPRAFGDFPEGPPSQVPAATGSAFFHLLPLLGQQPIYDGSRSQFGYPHYQPLRRTEMKTLICPSDATTNRAGLSSYLVNDCLIPRFRTPQYSLSTIPDGSSNTILTSESSARFIERERRTARSGGVAIREIEWAADWNFYLLTSGGARVSSGVGGNHRTKVSNQPRRHSLVDRRRVRDGFGSDRGFSLVRAIATR